MTDLPIHPLAAQFPNAVPFYLPDGTPAAITQADLSTRRGEVGVAYTIVVDGRRHDPKGIAKNVLFSVGNLMKMGDGVPASVGDPWKFGRDLSAKPFSGNASRFNEWKKMETAGSAGISGAVVNALRGALIDTFACAVLDRLAAYATEIETVRIPMCVEKVSKAESARDGSEWPDKLHGWAVDELRTARAELVPLTAFLATVAPYRETHGGTPDPEIAIRAARAAKAHAEASRIAEATRTANADRAAQRAHDKALADARMARLHGAAEEMLTMLSELAPDNAAVVALIARVEGGAP